MKKFAVVIAFAVSALTACGPTEEAQAPVDFEDTISAMAGPTWHLTSTESCFDLWVRSCSSTFPQPQCDSSVTHGAPCSNPGSNCWRTLNPNWVEDYDCY